MLTRAQFQRLRDLREKKHREAQGLFVVEGEKVVAELIAAGLPFEEIYATPEWTGRKTETVSAEEMARASHFPTPSSVLAVGRIERPSLGRGELDQGLTLALDGVQDPGNVGTIIRLADWFAIDRVLLSLTCADLYSQKVINATMGSFARVRTISTSLAEALSATTAPILGCDLSGDSVHTIAGLTNAVVVIGSEGRGISPEVAERLTQRITITRYGEAESLNAGIAAGIVCDNLRRLAK
jgi:TrmH family RNA methyltransferase